MPRIPEYTQQVDIQQQPTPQVNMENFTGGWKNATEAFKTLDSTVKEFKKVRDFNQKADATLAFEKDVEDIKFAAQNERDPSKLAEYQSKIDESIAKHSESISDGMLRKDVQANFQLNGYNTFSGIRNDFRKKEIDNGQAKFMVLSDKYTRSYSEASDDTSRRVIRDSYDDLLRSSQKSGLFDAADVAKLKITQDKDFDKSDLAYDIQNLPGEVMNRRKAGAYKTLTDAEVNEGITVANSMAEKLRKQNEEAVKLDQINNEVSLITGASRGEYVSIDEVSKMAGAGQIRQETAKAYIDFLSSPYSVNVETDGDAFAKMVSDVLATKNKDQISSFMTKALKGGADGKVSREDLAVLIAVANSKNETLLSSDKNTKKANSLWDMFSQVGTALKNFSDSAKLPKEVSNDAMKDFAIAMSTAKTEADIISAKNKIMDKAKASSNPKFTQYKVNDLITGKDKRAYKVVGFDTDGEPLVDLVK